MVKGYVSMDDIIKEAFEVLEIKEMLPLDEIKRQYRDLITVWHPDRHCSNERLRCRAEAKVKKLNAAWEFVRTNYEVIKDSIPNRATYQRPNNIVESRFVFKDDYVVDTIFNIWWSRDANVLEQPILAGKVDYHLFSKNDTTWYIDDVYNIVNKDKPGGYDNWRSPTIGELTSMIELALSKGYGDRHNRQLPQTHPISEYLNKIGFYNVQRGCYWSCERSEELIGFANFIDGFTNFLQPEMEHFIWFVRNIS